MEIINRVVWQKYTSEVEAPTFAKTILEDGRNYVINIRNIEEAV